MINKREQRSRLRMMDESLPERLLSKLSDEQKEKVEDAYLEYQHEVLKLMRRDKVSAHVPFLIKANDHLTMGKTQYDWTAYLEDFAYISSPNGFPMHYPEPLLGKYINSMKEAFEYWISLPGAARGNLRSWRLLSERHLEISNKKPTTDARYSQLRIPIRHIYPRSLDPDSVHEAPSEIMFDLEPVYDGTTRVRIDIALCDTLEAVLQHNSPYCELIRKMDPESPKRRSADSTGEESSRGECKKVSSMLCIASQVECGTRMTPAACEDSDSFKGAVCCKWHEATL
eukprot:TRINITY_DN27823_c0_g1_i1.p1 TRINITY_DN27823_c0_g1~~TRINITY_DN27823_c0_g1_i1.p1  ORF type:complete len:285 (-),score=26.22 TRINITY_DN27823_c0_g1_i1:19-873(-)